MKTKLAAIASLLLVVGYVSSQALASGFMVPELSASAMGKGSAIVADYDDPALIWYNVGGTAFLPPASISLGALFAFGHTEFEPAGGGEAVGTIDKFFTLPRVFMDAAVLDWMHVGFGFYTAYGLGNKYDEEWIGRVNAISAEMQSVSFNPTLAFKVHPQLGIGVGFVAMKAAAELVNGLPEAVGGKVLFGGEGWTYGAHAGVTFKAIPEVLSIGASYRSRMALGLDGRVDFDPHPDFAPVLLDQKGSAEINTPDYIRLGVSWFVTPRLRLSLDGDYVMWSVYDKLVLELEDGQQIATNYGYEDAFMVRIGVEWKPEAAEGLAIRGGFIYDDSPAVDGKVGPTLPDADKLNFCVGVGYQMDWLRFDAGYMLNYYLPNEVKGFDTTPDGTYKTLAHLASISVAAFWPEEKVEGGAE